VDKPLSGRGRSQARALCRGLERLGRSFDLLICSDLARARQTAGILAEGLGLPEPRLTPLLRELHCGDWEGITLEELRSNHRDAYLRWKRDPFFRIPGGESIMDVRIRVERFFREQAAPLEDGARVLMVAHGLLNRMVLSVILGADPQPTRYFAQDNTAINEFSWRDGSAFCERWNDVRHLEEVPPC